MFRKPSFAKSAGAIAIADDITLQFLIVELIQSGLLPASRALAVLDRSIAHHARLGGAGWPEDAALSHLIAVRSMLAASLAATEADDGSEADDGRSEESVIPARSKAAA